MMQRKVRGGNIRAEEVRKSPNEYAEMLLALIRAQTTSDRMIEVAKCNMDVIEVLKQVEPVRVTHMRNMIKIKQKQEQSDATSG
jgi:hypothetical protein